MTLVSVTSYAMYLINDKLLSRLFENLFQPLPVSFGFALAVYVLYWVTLLSLSYVMYRYFEKPMTNLRDFRWSSKKRFV